MVIELMKNNPGLSEQDAMAAVKSMSPGELVSEGANDRRDAPLQQRSLAPQGGPGLLGQQGGLPQRPNQLPPQQPQQPQKPPKSAAQLCAESGGQMSQDGMCHYTFNF